jgi:hypothetical protein
MNIPKKHIGHDPQTGLDIELHVKNVAIDFETERIYVTVEKVLISPTGVEMRLLETISYERFNSILNKKFDALRDSVVGQQIIVLLQSDLDLYPNMNQRSDEQIANAV